MQSSGLLLVRGAVFLGGMAAAASAGERRLAAVEIQHPLVGFVYEPVGRPGIVLLLAEFKPDKEGAAVWAGVHVHIALIALIDPSLGAEITAALRAAYFCELFIGKGIGFGYISGENKMLQSFGAVIGGAFLSASGSERPGSCVVLGKSLCHVEL